MCVYCKNKYIRHMDAERKKLEKQRRGQRGSAEK